MIEDIINSEVKETSFGLLTDNEKRDVMSVCCITSPMTLDSTLKQIPQGLYDCRMGPIDQGSGNCQTCGAAYASCPGHLGHIELDVPVYNPLLFASMYQLLRSKCFYCHRLRLSERRVRIFLLRLKLIEMGEFYAANLVDSFEMSSSSTEGDETFDDQLASYEARYEAFRTTVGRQVPMDIQAKFLQRAVIEEFTKAALSTRRCESCKAVSPVIRKDGHSKIFHKPISARNSTSFAFKTAMESIEDDDEITQDGDFEDDQENHSFDSTDKYLVPLEVEGQLRLLWAHSGDILDFIWKRCLSSDSGCWRIFFTRVILVPPNRFRPASKVGDTTSEHPQNVHLMRILEANSKVRLLQSNIYPGQKKIETASSASSLELSSLKSPAERSEMKTNSELSQLVSVWIDLQNSVNCYMDSAKDPNPLGSQGAPSGIRQLLERKEGLFRRHMMGKRVNYCCRSVISPDNNIGTNEIGIPLHFAMALHIPTPVNDWNVKYLRSLVERGPTEYPGANQIETADGRIIKLDKLTASERAGKAKLLLATPGNKVYRHLIDGDVLLVNRQPTLQKPGIMAHKARVLRFVKEQTLRMHYANCNTYNADFDGDEMNCHFVQNEIARSEATHICNNDNQYIGPTSGSPLRGLIQDHVSGGVKLTCKETFLNRSAFQQLLFVALTGLSGTEIVSEIDTITVPLPAILKPVALWTGKQVISALLSHMCRSTMPFLNLDGKTRTPPTAFGAEQLENEIVFRNGELLCGVLDKNSIGSVSMGVVHAVYELYGAEQAGRLLNAFGRLFTCVLQDFGLTCGIQDLTLKESADMERNALLSKVNVDCNAGLKSFLNSHLGQYSSDQVGIENVLSNDRGNSKVKLDSAMQSVINKSASEVIKACIPSGLKMPFLDNNFSMMVLTGAKGSAVNQSQISCFLGQQALEGQRVPLMISGKTLPSFQPFDGSARAGGFVRDRFLTGIRPQEYYFHCMAGREGLVDTAVKTSRSGYLQRCLVKHLEELKIGYDNTVRDSAGNIVQFLYGEDGLDPIQASLLGGKRNQLHFLSSNCRALSHKYSLHENFLNQGLEMDSSVVHNRLRSSAKHLLQQKSRISLSMLFVGCMVWARRKVNEVVEWNRSNIQKQWYTAVVVKIRKSSIDIQFSDGLVSKKIPLCIMCGIKVANSNDIEFMTVPVYLIKIGLPDTAMSSLRLDTSLGAVSERIQDAILDYVNDSVNDKSEVTREAFELLVWIKYMRSMACPGEAVGCVAAQSVGEPSTQMTLNTFHLAGHGGANVTLGIPRLREIIMTASKDLKTPTMSIPLVSMRNDDAKSIANRLSRISLASLFNHSTGVIVTERIIKNGVDWDRLYQVSLVFENLSSIQHAFGMGFEEVCDAVRKSFLSKLEQVLKAELRKAVAAAAAEPLQRFQFEHEITTHDETENDDEDLVKGKAVSDSGNDRKRFDSDDSSDSSVDSDSDSGNEETEDELIEVDESSGAEDGDAEISKVTSTKPSRKLNIHGDSLVVDSTVGRVQFNVSLPASFRRLLMAQLVERAASVTMVRATRNIATAVVSTSSTVDTTLVITEGVNFEAVWELDDGIVDVNGILSNDIHSILMTYGIEAARLSIVNEITSVFGVYGIDVNARHLSLIADFMTRNGVYTAMNRIGMNDCTSPFLQMSFETTCTFLNKAAFEGLSDNQQSPSARIVLGSVTKVGTGCFDLMLPLSV